MSHDEDHSFSVYDSGVQHLFRARVKSCMALKNISLSDVAESSGISAPNLSQALSFKTRRSMVGDIIQPRKKAWAAILESIGYSYEACFLEDGSIHGFPDPTELERALFQGQHVPPAKLE